MYKRQGKISSYYKKPIYTLYSGKNDAQILFTSGSTGNPKSVVLTNENYPFLGTTNAVNGTQTTTTKVMALCGSEQVPCKVGTIQGATGITAVSDGKSPEPTITITATSALTKSGNITIPIIVNGEITINKVFSYSIAFKGNTGDTGPKGTDGKGIKSTSVTYQAWDNGTNPPPSNSGWVTTPPKTTASKPYLWTKTVLTYTDNTSSPPSYSVGATPEGVEEKVDKNIKDQIAASEKTTEDSYKALIDQTAKDINLLVQKVQKDTDANSTSIASIATNFKVTSDGLQATKTAVNTLINAVNGTISSEEMKKYIRWNGDDLELGNSTQPFTCKLSSTELAFYQGDAKVAWISNNELHILKAVITESIKCGNFKFVDEGKLGFSLI